jgi:hypothetical protein
MSKSLTAPLLALLLNCICVDSDVSAQSFSNNGNAAVMWGTSSAGSASGGAFGSSAEASATHATNGLAASQANAARNGMLYPSNISIYAIGVQNITSVTGNYNSVTTNQTGSNTGNITNNGTVGGN